MAKALPKGVMPVAKALPKGVVPVAKGLAKGGKGCRQIYFPNSISKIKLNEQAPW